MCVLLPLADFRYTHRQAAVRRGVGKAVPRVRHDRVVSSGRGEQKQGEAMMRFVGLCCLVFSLSATALGGAALAQEIRISHQWTEGIDGRDRAARVFVQEVMSRTHGLTFRIYPKSSLNIKPPQLLGALQNNSLEMAIYPLTYAVAQVPEFSLAGLPGLVPNLEAARALKGSEIHNMLQSISEAN